MSPLALFRGGGFLYTMISVIAGYSGAPIQSMSSTLVPGALVRNPERPDWGLGQVQSVIGSRVTVNFENAGKLLINGAVVLLETVDIDSGSVTGPRAPASTTRLPLHSSDDE